MRALLALIALAACGGDPGNGSGTGDAGSDVDAASCVTTTPCTTDEDCKVAPGTRCNTALPIPRCQPLDCGHAGLPCAGPEFCAPGLLCFDEAGFGMDNLNLKAGVCSIWADTRDACNTRCMEAWMRSQGNVLYECTQQQATALCQHVCGQFPMWSTCQSDFEMVNANYWRFGYMNCPGGDLCPNVGLTCAGELTPGLAHEMPGCD